MQHAVILVLQYYSTIAHDTKFEYAPLPCTKIPATPSTRYIVIIETSVVNDSLQDALKKMLAMLTYCFSQETINVPTTPGCF